ncbi:hypothetical protein [Microvirga zambiensis]|uniref:hypothetical protein n=1 Tax=Microvirga zambiensis TaxID=1402137 RepID=UPI00191FE25E|nr:hypothetical protein [Microvirga zambiensis]
MNVLSASALGRISRTFDCNHNLLPREVEEMERLGIPADALAGPSPVRADYVVFDNLGFEFECHTEVGKDGTRAFLFPVTDGHGVARDVVAWSPQLGKLATWLGRAWALGEDTINAPRLSDHGALPVHRTPVGWLRARQRGICLVRPQAAAHYLEAAGPLLAEDAEHGVELKRLLTRPAPRILVSVSTFKKAS